MTYHSTTDVHEVKTLIQAVLDNQSELMLETLIIRTGWGRRPNTKSTEGVFFGRTGRTFGRGGRYRSEGYIVATLEGPRIATNVEFPASQREMLVIEDVDTVLGYLLEGKSEEGEAAFVLDVIKWKIKQLLPDTHPLKPHPRSYESRVGAEM